MKLQDTEKHVMLFEKDALGRTTKYQVEKIEETSNSNSVKLELFGGTTIMLPRKKFKGFKRFMESKNKYLVITMQWDGRLDSHCYNEKQYRKTLERVSSL